MANKKRKESLIVAGVLYAFTGFFLYKAYKLPDQAAFFPKMILFLLLLLTTLMLIKDLKDAGSADSKEEAKLDGKQMVAPLLMFLGITAFCLIFRFAGYFPATIVLFVALMLIFKVRPWWKILVITAGYLVFIYLMFVMWLQVQLL